MLWCDMEGIAGISVWEQVNGGAALYEEGRRLYTAEVNAAVRGCKRAGADRDRRDRRARRGRAVELQEPHPGAAGERRGVRARLHLGALYRAAEGGLRRRALRRRARDGRHAGRHSMPHRLLADLVQRADQRDAGGRSRASSRRSAATSTAPASSSPGDAATCREVQALLGRKW